MSLVYGENNVIHSTIEQIREEARTLSIAKQRLPIWTKQGLGDYSCTLHSAGTTYWNTMGEALGYTSISEMPAPQNGPCAFVGDDVRSDSLWFDARNHEPLVVVEFERYARQSDENKLVGKVDNLLLAYHRWGTKPRVLVLAYWTKGLATLPNHASLRRHVKQGFVTPAKERVEAAVDCELLFFQTVLSETDMGRWRLSQVVERGLQ